MGSFSLTGRSALLQCLLKPATRGPLEQTWFALVQQVPLIGDTGTQLAEPSFVDGYVRRPVPQTGWVLADHGTLTLDTGVQWSTATGDWGVIRGWALCSAASAGDVIASGELSAQMRVAVGQQPSLPSGSVRLVVA